MERQFVFLFAVSFAALCVGFAFAEDTNHEIGAPAPPTTTTTTTATATTTNSSCVDNTTECNSSNQDDKDPEYSNNPMRTLYENREMLQRAFYVLMAVTAVVVLYFVIKNVLLKRKQSKSVKYGIISTPGSDLEMQPLDQGDDDDDMTLYEARATKFK